MNMRQCEFSYWWWVMKFTPLLGSVFMVAAVLTLIMFFDAAAKFKLLAGITTPIILGIGVAWSLLRLVGCFRRMPPHDK